MEKIMAIIHWFQANAGQLLVILSSIIATASVIVKFTPTQKDDTVLAKIVAFLSKYVALNTDKHTTEEKPK